MVKQIVLISVIVVVVSIALMYLFQRYLIYYPSRKTPHLNDYDAKDMRVITLHTQDGLELTSWYRPANENQPTLLYLHGNAGNIGDRMSLVRQFMDAGLGVLLLEYRGYGGNKGEPTEPGFYEDGRAGMRFLQQQGIQNEQIALYGESLGSGVATKMASEHPVCAVILQSAYTSLSDMTRYYYPFVWFKPWDRFDSMQRIQTINAPLLLLHGLKDEVVPYSQGLALFQHALEPKKMLSFKLDGHNNIWNAPGFSEQVIRFIETQCGRKNHKNEG